MLIYFVPCFEAYAFSKFDNIIHLPLWAVRKDSYVKIGASLFPPFSILSSTASRCLAVPQPLTRMSNQIAASLQFIFSRIQSERETGGSVTNVAQLYCRECLKSFFEHSFPCARVCQFQCAILFIFAMNNK